MKINWGTGLAIVLGIFVIGMGTVTYKALNQKHDLVTTDYYAKELAYQETINRKKAALALSEPCQLQIKDKQLWIDFPSDIEGNVAEKVNIEMYCQNDAQLDFTISDTNWTIADLPLPSQKLASGKWIAKIHLDGPDFKLYFDPEIALP